MKFRNWIWVGTFLLGSSALGQDQPQAAEEGKLNQAEEPLNAQDIQHRNEYRYKLINGQRALGNARSELETAQRRLQELRHKPPVDLAQDQAEQAEVKGLEEVAQAQHKIDVARFDLNILARTSENLGLVRRTVSAPAARPPDANQPTDFVTTYGLDFVEADAVLRSQLGLPTGQGLVVVVITPGGLAEQAGLKENDLILKLKEQPTTTAAQATELIAKVGKGAIEVELIRQGKPLRLSLVGPNHGQSSGPTVYWIGVPVSAVDATLRSHLAALPADAGLVVNDVVADSPAAKGGIQKTDILIKCNEKLLTSQEVLIEQVQKSGGEVVKIEALRGGKVIAVSVVPEKRPATNAQALNDLVKDMNVATGSRFTFRTVPSFIAPTDRRRIGPQYDAIVVNPNQVYGTTKDGSSPNQDGIVAQPAPPRIFMQPQNFRQATPLGDREIQDLSRQVEELRELINELRRQQRADKKPAVEN